jgi:hypothetical protein
MTVRRRIVGRHEDGRKVVVIFGDEMHWKYDPKEEIFHAVSDDGKVRYAVAKSRPTEKDRFGHRLYRYWMARAIEGGETTNLGDLHMVAFEGKEVCQIWESSRHEARGDARVHDRGPRRLGVCRNDKQDT